MLHNAARVIRLGYRGGNLQRCLSRIKLPDSD